MDASAGPGQSSRLLLWLLLLGVMIAAAAGCAGPAALGQELLAGGKVDEAVAQLTAASREHPEDPDLQAALGMALRRAGKLAEAEAHLRGALTLNPDHLLARRELLGLLLEQERLLQAVAAAEELRRVSPEDPAIAPARFADLLLRAGRQALDTQQLLSAITLLERLLTLEPARRAEVAPQLGRAYEAYALLLAESDRRADALTATDQAISLLGERPNLLRSRAELLLQTGQVADAGRTFDRLLEQAGDVVDAARQAGASMRKVKKPELAVRYYERAVAGPGAVRGQDLLTLAELHLELGQPLQARDALDRFVALRTGAVAALIEAAGVCERAGNGELARLFLGRAVDAAPADFETVETFADLLLRQGRRDEALAAIERYRRHAPPAEAHFETAQWLRSQGDLTRALEAYRQALAVTPDRTVIYLRLAEVLRELRKPAERRQALDRFVQHSPDKAAAHRKVAGIYADGGDTPEAIRHLDAVLRLQPQDPSIHLDRARVYEAAKQPAREEEAWQAYLRGSSDPAAAAREVALRYQARGDLERARRFLELGLQSAREPELRLGLLLLAVDVQRRLDDPDGLQVALERLLAEPATPREKQPVLQQALEAMDKAQAPALKLKVLDELVRLQPELAALQLLLGETHLQLRSWAAAASAFSRYEELSTDRVAALGKIVRAYSGAQRLDLALEAMNRMVALGQDDPRTLLGVIELRLEQSGPGDEETMKLIEQLLAKAPPAEIDILAFAHRLEDWRLFGFAEKAYLHADKRSRLGLGDLKRLGRVLLQQRKVSEAEALLLRTEQELSGRELARIWMEWGQVCSEVGLPDLAVRLFGRVLEQRGGPVHQAFQLAVEALQQTGDKGTLEVLATRYATLATPPEEVHSAIARAWMLMGDDELALVSWRRVLVYDPASQEALQQTASILLRRGRLDEAGGFIERQIRESGDKPDAWLGLARRYRRWGALREAVRYYDVALARGADRATTLLERGKALLSLGERAAGKESIDEALSLLHGEGQDSLRLEDVGNHYVSVGWDEMALETFRRGVALDRSNHRFYALQVELHLRSGKLDLARRVVAEARANGMNRTFSLGLVFEDAGYMQQAATIYRGLIEQGLEGQVGPAFWRLGVDLVERGLVDRLAPLAQRYLAAVNDSFEGHWLVALLYGRAGRNEVALQHLLAGAEKSGAAEKRWLLVADAALRAGRRETALEALLRHAAPPRASGEANEAIELLLQRGEGDLAYALLDRLRSSVLGPAAYRLATGRLHLRLGDLWGGARLLQQAVAGAREGERPNVEREAVEALLEANLLQEALDLLLGGALPLDKEGQGLLLRIRAQQGDGPQLRQALDAYLAASPQDECQDRINAGAILRGQGMFARAAELLRRAMQTAPTSDERRVALYHLLASLHAQGLDQELEAEARRYVEHSPAPVTATHEVVRELAKLNRWELALELTSRRRALARTDHRLLQDELEARLALGQEQAIDGLVVDMVQHAFASSADNRSRPEILGRVAGRLAWSLRSAEAIRRWSELLQMAPAEFAPLERMIGVALDAGDEAALGDLIPRFLEAGGQRPVIWRWLTQRLVGAGRGREALPFARQLVQATSPDVRDGLLLVAASLQAGDPSAAESAAEALLQQAGDPARTRVALAALWLRGGFPLPDVDEDGDWLPRRVATPVLRRVVELVEPVCVSGPAGHATGLLLRGLARLRLGEAKLADRDLDEFLRRGGGFSAALLDPFPYEERDEVEPGKLTEMMQERLGAVAGREASLLLLIDAYLAAGRDERASTLTEQLIGLASSPEHALARVLQRAAYHERTRLGLELMDRYGRRFAGSSWEVDMLATFLDRKGDVDGAIRAYRNGIRPEPYQAVFYNNLAYFFAQHDRDLEEALKLVQQARKLGPGGEKFYLDTEGWVLLQLGRKEEALQKIQASVWLLDLGMGSSVAESLYHLGRAQLAVGRPEQAAASFRRAAAVDLHGEYGRRAQEELRKLGKAAAGERS